MYSLPLTYVTTLGAGGLLLYLLNILNQPNDKLLIAATIWSSDDALKDPFNAAYISRTSSCAKT